MSRRRHRHRTGFTLVELLVALPLATLAAATAALLLVRQAQHMRVAESRSSGSRELRHARLTLETELAPLHPGDFTSIADSLIEFRAQLGIVRACAIQGNGVLVVSAAESDRPWLAAVRAGDAITVWQWPVQTGGEPTAHSSPISGPASPLTVGLCGADSSRLRWTIPVTGIVAGMRLVGAPARIQRDTRYSHYRSGTHWWLGRRTRDATGWDGVQPVAGPLLSASAKGMRIRALDASGNGTHAVDSVSAVTLELRAPRAVARGARTTYDSTLFEVSLRGARTGGRP
jgi:prepilin-type N-terminal cleavage/methylation domain-containing protein